MRHEVFNPTLEQAPVSISRRPRLTATSVVRVGRIAVPAAEVMEAHRPLAGNAPKPVAYNALDVGHTGSRQGAVLVKTAVCSRLADGISNSGASTCQIQIESTRLV